MMNMRTLFQVSEFSPSLLGFLFRSGAGASDREQWALEPLGMIQCFLGSFPGPGNMVAWGVQASRWCMITGLHLGHAPACTTLWHNQGQVLLPEECLSLVSYSSFRGGRFRPSWHRWDFADNYPMKRWLCRTQQFYRRMCHLFRAE